MSSPTFNPFLIGCIGALAPEIIRVYKLRLSPAVRWSWGYLLFSFPFILLGGFMAYILEPTTSYAAFYTGVSTPFIVTTLAKDSEREARAIQDLTRDKNRLEAELYDLQQRPSFSAEAAAASSDAPATERDNTSDHPALRSTSPSRRMSPASGKNPTNYYSPRALPRRSHRRLFGEQIVQAFLKGL